MIRIYGKATVSTWRPLSSAEGSQMRSAQRESDDVTVLDQMVILQHHDGFWETYPLCNCSIIWQGKPTVTLVTEEDRETLLPLSGRDHTLADVLAEHSFIRRGPTRPMESSDTSIEGADIIAKTFPKDVGENGSSTFPTERTYE